MRRLFSEQMLPSQFGARLELVCSQVEKLIWAKFRTSPAQTLALLRRVPDLLWPGVTGCSGAPEGEWGRVRRDAAEHRDGAPLVQALFRAYLLPTVNRTMPHSASITRA